MSERQLIYRGVTFLSGIFFAFLVLIEKVKGESTPILKLLQDLSSIAIVLFAALWLRNLALIIAATLYLLQFNLTVFRNPILSNTSIQSFAKVFSFYKLIVSIIILGLFLIGISKNKILIALTKERKFSDLSFLIGFVLCTLIIQFVVRLVIT